MEDLLGAVDGEDPQPVTIKLKGIDTFQRKQPEKARIVYIDIVKNEAYETLQKISSAVISAFLDKGVMQEKELDKVTRDPRTGLWTPNFHLTMMKAQRGPIDAKPLLEKFGNAFIGQYTLKNVQISSRSEFETTEENSRMARELYY
jgi:2'-5' RNA ligase